MQNTQQFWLQTLLTHYEPYFDITTNPGTAPLKAVCIFHSRSEKYVLIKKAQLWAAESNEYLYLFSVPHLSMEVYELCRNQALTLGMEQVKPHSEHMYSYITAIILCDTADADALQALERYKKSQTFKLSLYGWMDYRIAAVNMADSKVYANKSGKDVKQFLQKIAIQR